MESKSNSNRDCGCSDGCCTPQKKNSLWKKIVFIAIILAVGAIITLKLVNKDSATPAPCCANPENASCCQPKTEEQ